ncbi:hypothetical protein MBANPS3_009601 [Mucor bainieri]
MKLRDKKQRALKAVKQEDRKADIVLNDVSSSSTINDPTTDSVGGIKQEDTKENDKLLKQHGEYDERDYYYRCDR